MVFSVPRFLLPLAMGLFAAGLAGCAAGPDYRAPEPEAGPAFVHAGADGFKPGGIDSLWWRRFDDPLLAELVELTVKNNRDLKVAEANLREARALFLEAGLELLPTVTAQARHTDQKRSLDALNRRTFAPPGLSLYNIGFDATWEIDIFGRLRRNVEARGADIETVEADRRDLIVSLIAEVARNYFELRGHQNQMAVARRNAENQAHTLELTQVRLDAGVGTELDTARAKAQLDTTLATIPPIEAQIFQAIHRLGVLTGQPPAALSRTLSDPRPLPPPPDLVKIGNPTELLRRRPDLRAAERSLAAATALIGVATADLYPRVVFNGSVSLESRTLGGLGATGSDAYSFGPRITWAFLDLGQVRARIRAADARAEASLAQFEQAVLTALEETENALVNYSRQRARTALLASAADASEKAHQLAHLRFEDGVADFLTVLDAERRLLEDQRQLAQSRTATATTLVALYKALGGGWEIYTAAETPEDRHPLERVLGP
jgi:multidrug efflux system outer membrane protein